jgi:hypothetical protein
MHVPRQLEPKGKREGCGKAMSSARSVGIKKGQAKNEAPWNLLLIDCTHTGGCGQL